MPQAESFGGTALSTSNQEIMEERPAVQLDVAIQVVAIEFAIARAILIQRQLNCVERGTYHTALCPFDGVELLVPGDAVVVVVGTETEDAPADGRSIGVGTTVEFALGVGISS